MLEGVNQGKTMESSQTEVAQRRENPQEQERELKSMRSRRK